MDTTLIWFVILLCVSAAACQPAPEVTPTVRSASSTLTDRPSETVIAPSPTPELTWARLSGNGVTVRILVPPGWTQDTTEDGIVLSEHSATMESGGALEGVQILLFIHPVSGFNYPAGETNRARTVLSQLIQMPNYVNADAAVSTPVGFTWGGYDAAYYLLNKGHGRLEMVLALAVSPDELVACNISAPDSLSDGIRRSVPAVLSSLTINGQRLDGSPLDGLPDPLEFPAYEEDSTPEAP